MVFMWIWELHSLNENHLVWISSLFFFWLVPCMDGFIQVQVHYACVQHQILHIIMHSPFSYIHQAYNVHLKIVSFNKLKYQPLPSGCTWGKTILIVMIIT
jgi:hypothetical protein